MKFGTHTRPGPNNCRRPYDSDSSQRQQQPQGQQYMSPVSSVFQTVEILSLNSIGNKHTQSRDLNVHVRLQSAVVRVCFFLLSPPLFQPVTSDLVNLLLLNMLGFELGNKGDPKEPLLNLNLTYTTTWTLLKDVSTKIYQFLPNLTFSIYSPFWGKVTKVYLPPPLKIPTDAFATNR